MSGRDAIAPLIPFYANGTLDETERSRVEAHLAGCESCRALLAHALAFGETAPDALEEHVQSQLLLEYLEARETLEPDAVRRIEGHLGSCEVCRDALAIVKELPGERAEAPGRSPGVLAGLWERLAGTVLHPAPALAYLLLLLIAYPAYRFLAPGGPDAPASVLGVTATLRGETVFRADPGEPAPPAASLTRPPDGAPLLLELATDIDAGDLRDTDATFLVELTHGERTLIEQPRRGADFDDGATLRVVIYPDRLEPDTDYTLSIRFHKPGDPLDGRVLFRHAFRLVDQAATRSPAAARP